MLSIDPKTSRKLCSAGRRWKGGNAESNIMVTLKKIRLFLKAATFPILQPTPCYFLILNLYYSNSSYSSCLSDAHHEHFLPLYRLLFILLIISFATISILDEHSIILFLLFLSVLCRNTPKNNHPRLVL